MVVIIFRILLIVAVIGLPFLFVWGVLSAKDKKRQIQTKTDKLKTLREELRLKKETLANEKEMQNIQSEIIKTENELNQLNTKSLKENI